MPSNYSVYLYANKNQFISVSVLVEHEEKSKTSFILTLATLVWLWCGWPTAICAKFVPDGFKLSSRLHNETDWRRFHSQLSTTPVAMYYQGLRYLVPTSFVSTFSQLLLPFTLNLLKEHLFHRLLSNTTNISRMALELLI